MDWNQQTQTLMSNWADAQRQLWSGWMGWMQNAQGGNAMGSMFDPAQLSRMGVDAWSSLREGAPGRVAGNIFGMPDVMGRSINLLLKSWQVVAPNIEAGKPWQPDLQKLMEQWREEVAGMGSRQASTVNEFQQLSQTMFEQWSPMTAPWLSMVGQVMSGGHPGEALMGGTKGLSHLLHMDESAFPMLSGIGDMPRGTVMRQKIGKILEAADATIDVRKAQAKYHKAMSDAMAQAVERTMDYLAKLAEKGDKITSVRDLMRTWFSMADRTLNKTFTSQEWLDLQGELTTALMTHKIKQREALEIIYEALEIPTRAEVDEAYRDIQNLKREVRKLKKQLATAGSAAAKGTTRRAPARKTPAKAATAG